MEFQNGPDGVSIVVQALSTVLGLTNDGILRAAEDSSFVRLGGDSLGAISAAAACQKRGIYIPASLLLRASSIKAILSEAEIRAQSISTPSSPKTLVEYSPFSSLFDTSSLASPGMSRVHTENSGYDSSSSDDIGCVTPESIVTTTPLSHSGHDVITAKDLLARLDPTEWTEPQLLLLQESCNHPNRNILTIRETYDGEWDAGHVCATWINAILAEPIFRDLIVDLNSTAQQLLPHQIISVEKYEDAWISWQDVAIAHGGLSQLTAFKSGSFVTVIWHVHHAFMDGYSSRFICGKINRFLYGKLPSISPGPSFKGFVRDLQMLRQQKECETRAFWNTKRRQFSQAIGDLYLSPQSFRAPRTLALSQRSFTITVSDVELAAARGNTGYTSTVYFAAAWALTLGTLMDNDQVYFGMVISGRDIPVAGAFDVVGPLINMLPLFVQLPRGGDRETSLKMFLGSIQAGLFELNDFQHSVTSDGFDRQFDSIMATQFHSEEATQPPTEMSGPEHVMQSGVPLNLIVHEQCELQLLFSTEHYSEEDMETVCAIFRSSMHLILKNSDQSLLAPVIRHLLPPEMEQIVRQWSNCDSSESLDSSKNNDLVTLFEGVVDRQPQLTAITQGRGDMQMNMSYHEFDQAADSVAQRLHGVQPNEPICVLADRSINWLVAIFGVLKAGGVYTPLDPSAPASVRHANIVRSGARAVVFTSDISLATERTRYSNYRIMSVESILAQCCTQERHRGNPCARRHAARPDDLAYICFTSGSTGQPKAVQCTHKGLVAFQKDQTVRLNALPGTVIAQVMSPVFDGSIHEIFSALTYGATLQLASPDTQDDPFSHLEDCDSTILTPSIAGALDPDKYPRLSHVYLVGEAVPQQVCDTWARNHTLFNMYGPTETTCGATIKKLTAGEAVTLGHANASSRIYVLDRNHCLLPPGAVGELYLAGIQVSKGYIGLESENAQRFLPDSILPESNQKMYKTGDFGYWDRRTGEVCILGRKDRQIKLHGYRLDLDDLESRITKAIPGCAGTAVFLRDDSLVAAYLVSSSSALGLDELQVRAFISDVLPPYAIPRRTFDVTEFPLTAAGKLDYRRLERMDDARAMRPPTPHKTSTATELMIMDAVRDLMRFDANIPLTPDSDITDLGGDSIVQLRLASRISASIGAKFPVRNILKSPTISNLAALVDQTTNELVTWQERLFPNRNNTPEDALEECDSNVSSIERYWFLKYQQNLGTSSFNVSHVSVLSRSFDGHQALVSAWSKILAKHRLLRCRFRSSPSGKGAVEKFFATDAPEALYVQTLDVRAEINREFVLEKDHLIRVLVSPRHMVVCVSHIICDYTTLDQLFREFCAIYHSKGELGETPVLRNNHLDLRGRGAVVDQRTVSFWRSYLSGLDKSQVSSYMKKPRVSYQGHSRMFQLSKKAAINLRRMSQALHLTMQQISLTIVSMVLQAENETKQDLILGSPYLGREEDEMGSIGLFLQPLPVRIPRRSRSGDNLTTASILDFFHLVQQSARSSLSHALEWASLMNILSSSSDENLRSLTDTAAPNHPLFEAMVTFHERSATTGKSSPLEDGLIPGVEPLITWTEGAKFGIMFEFSAMKADVVTLRVEHDTSAFSTEEVLEMVQRIDLGLEYMYRGLETLTVGEFEYELLQMGSSMVSDNHLKEVVFGTSLIS